MSAVRIVTFLIIACALLIYLLTYKDQWWRHLVNAYEVKAYVWCKLQVELCDPYLSALSVLQ